MGTNSSLGFDNSPTIDAICPGAGDPVPGSRWQDTGFATIAGPGSLSILSPVPGPAERVVVDWLSFAYQITISLGLFGAQVRIEEVGSGTIIWNSAQGFAAGIGLGASTEFEQTGLCLRGAPGEQLRLVSPGGGLGFTIIAANNFGGYLET